MGTKQGNNLDKRAKGTQEVVKRIEQLLAESKRLQEEHAVLSKKLKELLRRILDSCGFPGKGVRLSGPVIG